MQVYFHLLLLRVFQRDKKEHRALAGEDEERDLKAKHHHEVYQVKKEQPVKHVKVHPIKYVEHSKKEHAAMIVEHSKKEHPMKVVEHKGKKEGRYLESSDEEEEGREMKAKHFHEQHYYVEHPTFVVEHSKKEKHPKMFVEHSKKEHSAVIVEHEEPHYEVVVDSKKGRYLMESSDDDSEGRDLKYHVIAQKKAEPVFVQEVKTHYVKKAPVHVQRVEHPVFFDNKKDF